MHWLNGSSGNAPVLLEVAFETARRLGGIHRVVTSKAAKTARRFQGNYALVGWGGQLDVGFEPTAAPPAFENLRRRLSERGMVVEAGRLDVPGNPETILVDPKGLRMTEDLAREIRRTCGLDFDIRGIEERPIDIQAMIWSYAAGVFLEALADLPGMASRMVVQAHEYMSGLALLRLAHRRPAVATVFTTHATVPGRHLAFLGVTDVLAVGPDRLEELMADVEHETPDKFHKHLYERHCVRRASVVTTVSERMAREVEHVHGRPTEVTLTGLDLTHPAFHADAPQRARTRKRILDFFRRWGGDALGPDQSDLDDALLLYSSGRHEFNNKGYGVFLDALELLDHRLREAGDVHRPVLFLLTVMLPGHRLTEAARRLTAGLDHGLDHPPPILVERDPPPRILAALAASGLDNGPEARVRGLLYPAPVTADDGLLSHPYLPLLCGLDVGVFPSYYEPWGYTAVEGPAAGTMSVTTDVAGFGAWVRPQVAADGSDGIQVLPVAGRSREEAARDLARRLHDLARLPRAEIERRCRRAPRWVSELDWSDLLDAQVRVVEMARARTDRHLETRTLNETDERKDTRPMMDNPFTPVRSAGEAPTRAEEFRRHRGPVTGVAQVPGTEQVVSSAYDGAVGLFDLETETVELLGYHWHLANRIVVDDQGSRAASCSSDYTICIWDLPRRQPLRVLRGHSDDVEDFLFVGDNLGVSASRDRRILVWNLSTGSIERVLEGHDKDVLSLAYHEGRIFSAGDDMTLRVWDLVSGRQVHMWGPFENETDTCAIDPLHGRVVLGCDDGWVRIFELETGDLVQEIEAHSSGIKKVAVSPRTGDVLSAAYDQNIGGGDAETFEQKLRMEKIPSTWERSLTWTPEGDRVLAGTFDGTVLVWNAQSGELAQEVGDRREPGNACFNDVAATADGDLALVADDGFVRLGRLDPGASEWVARVEPASGRRLMNAATLDARHHVVVTGSHDHKVHVFDWDGESLENEVAVPLDEGPINAVRVSRLEDHPGEIFVACYSSAIVRMSRQAEILDRIRVHEGAVKSLALHPSRPLGVSCGADGLLLAWSFDGKPLQQFRGHEAIINDVDLAPDGERLASVSRDFTLKIFEVASGRLLESVALGRRSLKSVCFFDQDTVLVGDYWGGVIRVDVSTGSTRREWIGANGISAMVPCGPHVVAACYDGAVYRIDPRDLSVVGELRAMTQRLLDRAAA